MRWRRAAPGLLFAALVVAVWADPLFTGRNFTGRDLLVYNLPMEKVIHDAYASGSLPVWNPWVSGGRPLLPNPNSGALYPIRMLMSVFPFELAMRIYPVLHWVAAGIGVLFLLGALGVGAEGAWLGAATYVFSGASVSEVFYPHIQPGFALLPWIVWALIRQPRLGRFSVPMLGFLLGLDFLAGDVFTAGLAVGCCLLWIATEVPREEGWKRLALLGGSLALGILLAAPQIVATALWIPETNRAVLGMKLWEATLFSVTPVRLLELFVPYPFGPTWELRPELIWHSVNPNGKALGLFSTLFLGSIVPIAWVRLARDSSPGLRFARWLGAAGLLVSVIPSVFPRAWGDWTSPLPLRNPEKLVIAVVLASAVFVGRALEDFRRRPPRFTLVMLPAAALTLAAVASAVWPSRVGAWAAAQLAGVPANGAIAAAAIPGGLAEAGLFWTITVAAIQVAGAGSRATAVVSLALLTLVPVAATRRIAALAHPRDVFAPTPFALRLRKWDPRADYRVLGEMIYRGGRAEDPSTKVALTEKQGRDWTRHVQALWERGTVFNTDFDSGDLARVESLRKVSPAAAGYRDSEAFFGNLSLKWGIRDAGQEPVSAYRRFGGDARQDWDEIGTAFPDLRLATRWRERRGALEALADLPKLGPGELLLETNRASLGTARPGFLRVVEKSANRLRLECQAPDPTWLFALRAFWGFRDVTVDGEPADVVPAYLAFSAIRIPAGIHRVEWRERIPGIAVSRWGPVLFLLGAAWCVRPRRRRVGNPSSSREVSGRNP